MVNYARIGMAVALGACLVLVACRTPSPVVDVAQEESAIRQVFRTYLKSVDSADVALASEVFAQADDIVLVAPFGRFQGWEMVRDVIYVKFLQQAFSERRLEASIVSIHVSGDTAWLVDDWTFTGKLADGGPTMSEGWESHVYQKTEQGWRIVQLHYSAAPSEPAPSTAPAAP